jgi:phospholipid/cholesterol/gamma-HCH transport system substrate-binding protein
VEKDKIIKIGLIVVLTVVFFYWGFNFLKGKNVFTQTNTYYAHYERTDGLQKNAAVLMRGHKIGQVTDITFTTSRYESLTVEMTIDKSIELPEYTIARIFSSDIMGTKSVDLILPDIEDNVYEVMKNGDFFVSEIEGSLQDQVRLQMAPLKKQAEDLIEQTSVAIEQVKYVLNENTGRQLKESFIKIQKAVDAIHNSSVTIDTILTNGNTNIQRTLSHVEKITKTVSDKDQEIARIIESFASISDSLAQSNVKETIMLTDSVMTELNGIIAKINAGEGSMGALIQNKDLYDNLEASSQKLDALLLDINENPKRYVSFPLISFPKNSKK